MGVWDGSKGINPVIPVMFVKSYTVQKVHSIKGSILRCRSYLAYNI